MQSSTCSIESGWSSAAGVHANSGEPLNGAKSKSKKTERSVTRAGEGVSPYRFHLLMTTRKDAAVRPLPSLAATNRAHRSHFRLSQTPAGASCAPGAQRPLHSLGVPFSPGWEVASPDRADRVLLLISDPVARRMPGTAPACAVFRRQPRRYSGQRRVLASGINAVERHGISSPREVRPCEESQ